MAPLNWSTSLKVKRFPVCESLKMVPQPLPLLQAKLPPPLVVLAMPAARPRPPGDARRRRRSMQKLKSAPAPDGGEFLHL